MITISCSACQKKLAVKDDAVGKAVKCPGCGQLTIVPAQVRAAVAGLGDMPTVPPASSQPEESSSPTHPPSEKPDATQGLRAESGHDASLTDFLAPPKADDELGRLGKYRILKILGHGGMGVVYKAEDPKLLRTVAIKAMLPILAASASAGKRFLREAQTMAAVKHDHIVSIYDVDEERGVPFMAMEFLQGEPLDERLKRSEPLSIAEMLRIGREIALGLEAAHATGLIHRDIKPANIWLESTATRGLALAESTASAKPQADGRVKILDFGLARAASQEAGLTQQGAIVGTPAYMAPEQGRGENVDARCDLFSLGVVLYRLSTGKAPFHGNDTVSMLMSVAMTDPPPPITLNPQLPTELSKLVMKLLEKDPAKRIGSAVEVVRAVQGIEEMIRKKESREPTIAMAVPVKKKASLDQVLFAVDDAPPAVGAPTSAGEPSRVSGRVEAPSNRAAQPGPLRGSARLILFAGAAFAFLALLAGGVYYWLTNTGTVRIEINDPAIKIAFDKTGPTITGVDKHDIKLSAGEHGMTIERGDLKFDTDKFILKRGATISLKIEWLKDGKLRVVQGDKVIGAKSKSKIAIGPASGDYALSFESGNGVALADSLKLDSSVPYTLEAYVTLRSAEKSQDFLVSYEHTALSFGAGRWNTGIWGPRLDEKSRPDSYGATSLNVAAAGKRAHLAGVFDGRRLAFFVDGKLQKTVEVKGPLVGVNKSVFNFGTTDTNYPNDFFANEVRLSKTARYTKDFTPARRFEPDADTLALYHCDEGRGDILMDSSGNGHHGKIIGAKWVNADGSPIVATPQPVDPDWVKLMAANPAAKPLNRDVTRHWELLAIANKGGVEVVFLGDSITQGWGNNPTWKTHFEPLKAANFGIGGDATGHVLWRITEGGELDNIKPKVAVLMIGTNNTSAHSANDIAGAIKLIVHTIHQKTPSTKVLLMGVFPRGVIAGTPLRKKIADINAILAKLDDGGTTVKYLDIGAKFLDKEGTISKEIMPDFLHLGAKGYEIWGDAIAPTLKELIRAWQPNLDKVDVISPPPPAGAIVLFDGKNLDAWTNRDGKPALWNLVDGGAMEAKSQNIITRQTFDGMFKLHVEFRVPYLPDKKGQARGNSGVFLQGRYELQILDSYGLKSGASDCGAIFGVSAPLKNVCKEPLVWQSYDIAFTAPKCKDGKIVEAGHITVFQNGIKIQDDVRIEKISTASLGGDPCTPGPIMLQFMGNAVQFRNIWLVPMKSAATSAEPP